MTVRKKRSTRARHYPRWDVRLLRGAMNEKDLLFRAAHAATIKLRLRRCAAGPGSASHSTGEKSMTVLPTRWVG